MAHQYLQPIQMAHQAGQPLRFTWREREYTVAEILLCWRLRDRWWEAPGPGGASDRHYYRLRCEDGLSAMSTTTPRATSGCSTACSIDKDDLEQERMSQKTQMHCGVKGHGCVACAAQGRDLRGAACQQRLQLPALGQFGRGAGGARRRAGHVRACADRPHDPRWRRPLPGRLRRARHSSQSSAANSLWPIHTFGDFPLPAQLVVLARNHAGYAQLVQLLTDANLENPDQPVIPFRALADAVTSGDEGLFVLTGGREGALSRMLLLKDQTQQAQELAQRYAALFGPERVFVELQHHQLPDSLHLMQRLVWLAEGAGLRCVATNGVHCARQDRRSPSMTCSPVCGWASRWISPMPNDRRMTRPTSRAPQRCRRSLGISRGGLPRWRRRTEIAEQCEVSLLKAHCVAPQVPLPDGSTPSHPPARPL